MRRDVLADLGDALQLGFALRVGLSFCGSPRQVRVTLRKADQRLGADDMARSSCSLA